VNAIIKRPHPPCDGREKYIAAMYVMFCRTPKNPNPDSDNRFDLGQIGSGPEKNWERLTPYSVSQRR